MHHTHQEVADVLQLVVTHCPDASELRTLCSLLQASRTVRQALLQALGHCSLRMPRLTQASHTSRLGACCAWLPRHAGLVTELSWGWQDGPVVGLHADRDATAQHLIGLALQLCTTQAAAIAATHLAQQPTWPPRALPAAVAAGVPWQLQRVRAKRLLTPIMLNALAACSSLTSLELCLGPQHNDTNLTAALGQMSQHLLQLQLTVHGTSALPEAFALGLSQLTRLRQLEASPSMPAAVARALPPSLTALTALLGTQQQQQPVVVSMAQAVGLQQLQLNVHGALGAASQLPPNTTQLLLDGGVAGAVQGLEELCQLELQCGRDCIPLLKQASLALPKLESLVVDVAECDADAQGGDAIAPGPGTELDSLLVGLAGARQLTKLVLVNSSAHAPAEPYPTPKELHGAQLHKHLAQLPALRHLDISSLDIQPRDAVHFTSLTALTALHLYNCWSIGEVAAAAVVARLPTLRVLELIDCGLESPVLWPAVGVCTSLESLCIDSAPHKSMVLDGCTLHLLSGLTRLTSLTGPQVQVSPEAFESFCAAMPALVERPFFE